MILPMNDLFLSKDSYQWRIIVKRNY